MERLYIWVSLKSMPSTLTLDEMCNQILHLNRVFCGIQLRANDIFGADPKKQGLLSEQKCSQGAKNLTMKTLISSSM